MSETEIFRVELADEDGSFGGQREKVTEMSTSAALSKIIGGEIRLVKDQQAPPLALISTLADLVDNLDAIGPSLSQDALTKIVGKLRPHHVLEEYVEGHEILWRNGIDSLEELSENVWHEMQDEHPSIMEQLRSAYDAAVERHGYRTFAHKPSDDQMKQQRLVREPASPLFSLDSPPKYYQLSPDWYACYTALNHLEAKRISSLKVAFEERRIVAFEERANGVIPLAPGKAFGRSPDSICRFVLTRDLPEAWLRVEMPRHKAIAEAVRWLQRAYAVLSALDKRMSRDQAICEMTVRFGLSGKAAESAWGDDKNPWKGNTGKVPRKQAIEMNEIKDI